MKTADLGPIIAIIVAVKAATIIGDNRDMVGDIAIIVAAFTATIIAIIATTITALCQGHKNRSWE